jgi:MarR family transcriptional regulator, organic hydroperoxide resistance regulator
MFKCANRLRQRKRLDFQSMVKKSPSAKSAKPAKPAKSPIETQRGQGPALDNDLQDSIPYLIARAGVRMGQAFTRELRPFKLTLTEWRVCSTLNHQPHQRLSEVALNTSTEQSTLSRVVDGLLQRGLLVRDRSDGDARALALSLTPQGLEITQRLIPLAQLYERVSLNGFSPEQASQLRDMLKRLYDNMAPLDQGP